MPLDFNEIRQLLAEIAQTNITEVILKSEDFELTVRTNTGFGHQNSSGEINFGVEMGSQTTSMLPNIPNHQVDKLDTIVSTAQSSTQTEGGLATSGGKEQKLGEVLSPIVGTFYRASAPGESVFVEVGDRIRKGDTVCIVEAMKVMNEIEAELSGQVMEILVENGDSVEYGQPLMRINTD